MCRYPGVPVQGGGVADVAADNAVEAELQICSSRRVKQQVIDALPDRDIKMGSRRKAKRRASGLRRNLPLEREGNLADSITLGHQTGKGQQVVIAGSAGQRPGRNRRRTQLTHTTAPRDTFPGQRRRTRNLAAEETERLLSKAQLVGPAHDDPAICLERCPDFQPLADSARR